MAGIRAERVQRLCWGPLFLALLVQSWAAGQDEDEAGSVNKLIEGGP